MILDNITQENKESPPRAPLFADYLVICDESKEKMDERVEN